MSGPTSGCFDYLRSESSTSSSSGSSTEIVTPANSTYIPTTLADLVRESESDTEVKNWKANESNAEHITPTPSSYLIPTAIQSPGSTHCDLLYLPGDCAFQWTYARSLSNQGSQQAFAELDSSAGLPGRREVMAIYTGAGGWRTKPRGSYAVSKFGAVGERLVPQTVHEDGEVEIAAAHEHSFEEVEALKWRDLK